MGILNKFDNANEKIKNASSVLDNASSSLKGISKTYGNIKNFKSTLDSDEYKQKQNKIYRYEKVTDNLIIFFVILYIAMIIATIVLCATNNDIIIKLLGLR